MEITVGLGIACVLLVIACSVVYKKLQDSLTREASQSSALETSQVSLTENDTKIEELEGKLKAANEVAHEWSEASGSLQRRIDRYNQVLADAGGVSLSIDSAQAHEVAELAARKADIDPSTVALKVNMSDKDRKWRYSFMVDGKSKLNAVGRFDTEELCRMAAGIAPLVAGLGLVKAGWFDEAEDSGNGQEPEKAEAEEH